MSGINFDRTASCRLAIMSLDVGDHLSISEAAGVVTVALDFSALPEYADDAAAGVGGLVAGQLYRTALGAVMVKL